MTAAEWEELRALHGDIRSLRATLTEVQLSLAGCQAASKARMAMLDQRTPRVSAIAAVVSAVVATAAAAMALFHR
jgi:hypothetical protein